VIIVPLFQVLLPFQPRLPGSNSVSRRMFNLLLLFLHRG
jgi:hypothetical protein